MKSSRGIAGGRAKRWLGVALIVIALWIVLDVATGRRITGGRVALDVIVGATIAFLLVLVDTGVKGRRDRASR